MHRIEVVKISRFFFFIFLMILEDCPLQYAIVTMPKQDISARPIYIKDVGSFLTLWVGAHIQYVCFFDLVSFLRKFGLRKPS